jgi:Cu(I)/Ag(I) efflux system membrane fusion protein
MMKKIKELWQSPFRWLVVGFIVLAFILGILISGGSGGEAGHEHGQEQAGEAPKAETWTCSMHPQIRQPKPGKCPICFMDLVPVESGGGEEVGPRQLKLSANAVKLAGIQTVPVERRFVASDIRMVGKVKYDETRLSYITARVPGRLDRLYVDYTGVPVNKGDHLVYLYSPELITAQQELLQALKSHKKFRTGKVVVEAAREKLKLWGLSPGQVKEIEKRGKPTDHLTINSPISGIVIRKDAMEGMYVKTGTRIYTIADLSRVWVKLDAYESDLSWIRYGQTVTFETEAYPGESFEGRIAFIDPVLDSKTRTVKVRVNVSNAQLKLKPEMFVRAIVKSRVSVSGMVMDPELAGKWISPMHPEIIKDGPGKCDVCGMPLVRASKLGFLTPDKEAREAPLVIPSSAPLITGKRAVVYVAVKDKEGLFEGREIILGPRAGNFFVVREGLSEGESVVVNGAFKIDSDLQIQAKPSMMSPKGGVPAPGHDHGETHTTVKETPVSIDRAGVPGVFRKSFDSVADAYFNIQYALSSDDLEGSKKAAKGFLEKLAVIDMKQLKGDAHMKWMDMEKTLKSAASTLSGAGDIEAARVQLEVLTGPITMGAQYFGSGDRGIYRFHCPMAFDNKGAYWLQNNDDTRNPYFGESMLKCIDSVEPLEKKK